MNIHEELTFKQVTTDFVQKQINSISVKKATGVDNISSELLRITQPVLTRPLTALINMSMKKSTFPNALKKAQVVPIHTKNSILDKGNYWPVSVLPTISNFFERAINSQLTEHFNSIFNHFLAAFRSGYGCQSTLRRIAEDWKKALDANKYVGAILMDLLKAFDCLPMLYFYFNWENMACHHLPSTLYNHISRTEASVTSTYESIFKRVQQGSILGASFV